MGQRMSSSPSAVSSRSSSVVLQGYNEIKGSQEKEIRELCVNNLTTKATYPHLINTDNVGADVSSSNGLVFEDRVVPEEVLTLILSYVEPRSLLNCRLVCHTWKQVVDSQIWRHLLRKDVYKSLQCHPEVRELSFYSYYLLHVHDPFNKNLIKNPSGKELMKHWQIVKNEGDRWAVEDPPNGAQELLPASEGCDDSSCFATSFAECYKVQQINLSKFGALPYVLEILKPRIHVSEWYAARQDCGCIYDLCVELLDRNEQVLDDVVIQRTEEQWLGGNWHKVSHEFKYVKGMKYIRFLHGGRDSQFWSGHYGSKMRNACVKIIL